MKDWKSEQLLTPMDCVRYGNSPHIQSVIRQLENLQNGTLKPGNITKSDIINIRNYLIVILCIINAARASNIINTTVADVEAATQGSEFPGWCFKSKKYKTSMIYDTKVYLRFG